MKTPQRAAALLLCLLAVLWCALPARAVSAQDMALAKQTEAYFAEELAKARVPGAVVAVVGADGLQTVRSYGEVPAPPEESAFVIGSLSKSFTALAVLQLAEAGALQLSDPVGKYLPALAEKQPAAQIVTLEELLHHTGGISTYETTANLHFGGEAGQFAYSNAGYNLLGQVVEAASGMTYEDYLQQRVFAPLGMAHSYTNLDTAREARKLVPGHRSWFGAVHPYDMPQPGQDAFIGPASGSLAVSAEDMALYLKLFLQRGEGPGGPLLSPEGIATLLTATAPTGNDPAAADLFADIPGKYAMGWLEKEVEGQQVLYHTGKVSGYNALMVLLPQKGIGLVALYNLGDLLVGAPMMEKIGEGAIAIMLGGTATAQWQHSYLLQHGVIDLMCLVVVLTGLMPLFLFGVWRRRAPKNAEGLGLYVRLGLVHLLYPLALLCALPLLGIPPDLLADFVPDIALVLYATAALLLAMGIAKVVFLSHLKRPPPPPADSIPRW